jgi:hypothetical protein
MKTIFNKVIVLYILAIVFRGLLFYWMWEWFLAPLGVPHISNIAHAFGISIMIQMIEGYRQEDAFRVEPAVRSTLLVSVYCLLGLLFHIMM